MVDGLGNFAEGQPKMIPPSVFETIALTLVFFLIVVGVTQKAITPIRLDHHHTSEVEVVADAAWLEVDGGDRDDFTVFQLVTVGIDHCGIGGKSDVVHPFHGLVTHFQRGVLKVDDEIGCRAIVDDPALRKGTLYAVGLQWCASLGERNRHVGGQNPYLADERALA